jgi:hypothetical protein
MQVHRAAGTCTLQDYYNRKSEKLDICVEIAHNVIDASSTESCSSSHGGDKLAKLGLNEAFACR